MRLDENRINALKILENKIGYCFKDIKKLNTALTHSSYISGRKDAIEHNERLEFIGDSVLSMIISLHLYKTLKDSPEGQLTRIRANIVCEQSLYTAANTLDLGSYLLMSRGEENTGGRTRASILADAFEAVIAAIYLDGGLLHTQKFVMNSLVTIIDNSMQNKIFNDHKSFLQEYIQKSILGTISYVLDGECGPDHNKTFRMSVFLNDKLIGSGEGKSKKDAQQAAAKNAIERLEISHE